MDKAVLCNSLQKWLETFELSGSADTVHDINNGVAMAQVLSIIEPEWFNETWLSKIKTDTGNNWRLKVSNLKKIVDSIVDYYHEILGQNISGFGLPDVTKIAESNDKAETGRMLQLILGCAVKCENNQEYIRRIMDMEESLQQIIMQAIQELMTRELSGSQDDLGSLGMMSAINPPGVDHQMRQLLADLEAARESRENMVLRVQELDMQVSLLQEEKTNLASENDRLNTQIKELQATEDAPTQIQRLRKQMETLVEENEKLDQAREEYRIRVELLEREYNEAKQQAEAATSANEVARRLQDELDASREALMQAEHQQQTIQTYKKKLEEQADVKRQVRILEDKNVEYMNQKIALEEEVQKALTWKPQAETYKKQLTDLRSQLTNETRRADKAEVEAKRHMEKLSALVREKEVLIGEREALRESYEELKCSALQPGSPSPSQSTLTDTDGLDMLPPVIREKLHRLQLENKSLKEKDRTETMVLRVQLEQLQEREKQLSAENRESTRKIIELEAQLEEMKSGEEKSVEDDTSSKTQQVNKIRQLEEALSQKSGEMAAMEERYKKYIDKAKSIIRSLDCKPRSVNTHAPPDMLQQQLEERERIIRNLERETEKARAQREYEEKLMATAFYNMGLQLNRQSVEQRLAGVSAGQSFLSRQRQAAPRRINNSEFYDY